MQELKNKIAVLERALAREKRARRLAESILEKKSQELYEIDEALKTTNDHLEELISEKTSTLEGVFENIVDAYVVMDFQGNVLKMNQAAIDIFGFDHQKEKVSLLRLVKREFLSYTRKSFQQLLFSGRLCNYKIVINSRDNHEKIISVNASLIYNKEGKPTAAQGIVRDITEESNIKRLLEDQRNQLSTLIDNSPIGILLVEVKSRRILMANQAISKLFGYSEKELAKIARADLVHPDDEEDTRKLLQKLLRNEAETVLQEKRYFTKTGKLISTKTSATAVKNANKEIKHLVITIEDISAEKYAKEKLKESEARLSSLIRNLQTGILLEDENRSLLLVNQQFCDMFQIPVPPEALKGADCAEAAEASKGLFKKPKQFIERIEQLLENKQVALGDEMELVDGKIFERNYIPIYNEGRYKGHLWSYNDITLKKNYQRDLKTQKEKYSNIIANMKLGLIEVDLNGRIKFANQSFCDMSGYTFNELQGKIAGDIFLAQDTSRETYSEHREVRSRGVSDSYALEVKTKDGELRHWLISGAPNFDAKGNFTGSIGINLDITHQKRLEQQKEKLLENLEVQNEKLNEYAHIVSHDLKSPLRNISALLSWTKEDFKEKLGDESLVNLNLMEDKVEKMDHLIENILKYSSIESGKVKNEKIDLNSLVKRVSEMIYVPDHIQVEITKPLPKIYADETRIQQLFQNIISNAVNYIDKDKGLVEISFTEDDSDYIFSIKDNGVGIAKEHHEKIFKIFNSLGNDEKSTGIGLSIVKKVVDFYGGKIWLESEVGKYTIFYFTLKK